MSNGRMTSGLAAAQAALLMLLCIGGCHLPSRHRGPSAPGGGLPNAVGDKGNWIIVLAEFPGPARQQEAAAAKQYYEKRNWSGLGVLHDSDRQLSFLYLGMFERGKELDESLKRVHVYQDPESRGFPFRGAYDMALPGADPPAPTEWNLFHAKGFWTLQIAHYVQPSSAYPATQLLDYPPGWDRKKAAVEACGELRARGFEAYYCHGEHLSIVTVGTFSEETYGVGGTALKPIWINFDPRTGEYTEPRVKALRDTKAKMPDGKEDFIFRYNLENGLKIVKTIRGQKQPLPSFLIKIPRKKGVDIGAEQPNG